MTRAEEVSDEMLMALADGELNDLDARLLRKRIAIDPELAERFADFVETRAALQDAFPPEPVPARLIRTVLQAPAPQARVVALRKGFRAASSWGLALAASLLLAVGGFWIGRESGPQAVAALDLGAETAALPTGGERLLSDGNQARVLASYVTDLGLCRLIAHGGLRHLTCHDAETSRWALALSVPDTGTESFLPAADIGVALIDQLLTDIGAGPALTVDAERGALAR